MLAQGEKLQTFIDDMQYVSHVHISEPGLAPIQKRPEHRELALLLGMHRTTLTRILCRLREMNVLGRFTRHELRILDRVRLEELAGKV